MKQRDSSVWEGILKQMDGAAKPAPGRCANVHGHLATPGHIYCTECRAATGGYVVRAPKIAA